MHEATAAHQAAPGSSRALRAASQEAPRTVAVTATTEVERALLYRASDSLMNGLVWLDTHAPDWVRADIKQTRAALATALEHRQ